MTFAIALAAGAAFGAMVTLVVVRLVFARAGLG
jgi:hypothetical protein